MKTRYLIETENFVAPCDLDTPEQFGRFKKYGEKDCKKANSLVEEEIARQNLPDNAMPRYAFEYRDNFDKTETDKKSEELCKHGAEPFPVVRTKIYPESVLKDASSGFVDKQANWNNRHRKVEANLPTPIREAWEMDMNRMERHLDRAKQIRKDLKKRAPRTQTADLEKAAEYYLAGGLTQRGAEKKAGVPETSLSKGRGATILENRGANRVIDRTLRHGTGDHPKVPTKELEKNFLNEELRRGKEKD